MRFKIRILDNINENHLTTPVKTQTEESPNLSTSITNKQQVKKLKGIMKIQRMVLALKNFHIFKPENQESTEKQQDNTTITQDQLEIRENTSMNLINQGNDLQIQEIPNQAVNTTQEKVNNSMDIEKQQQVQQENSQQLEQIDNQLEKNHKLVNTEQDKEKNFISQECFQTQEILTKGNNIENYTPQCQAQENQTKVDNIDNHTTHYQGQEKQIIQNNLSQCETQENLTIINNENHLPLCQTQENMNLVNNNNHTSQFQTQENQIIVNNEDHISQLQAQENQIILDNLEKHIPQCQTQENQTQVDNVQYNISQCQIEEIKMDIHIPQKVDLETQTLQINIDSQIQCEIDIEEKSVNLKQQIIESMEKQKQLCFRTDQAQLKELAQNYSVVSIRQFYKINKDPFKLFNKIYYQIQKE